MKLKKILICMMAALMVLPTLASCSKKDDPKGDASSSSSGNSQTDKLKSELDFGGETITFVYPPGYGMIDKEGKDPAIKRRDERIKELEKKYNVVIEQKEGKGTYWDVMASSIVGGSPMGHVMVTQENFLMNWVGADAMADLSGAMEKTKINFTDERYNQLVRKMTNIDNKQYAFSDALSYPAGNIWYFNKRIFNEMNLGDPYQMIKNNEWTWNKVEEIAKKATIKRPDGTVSQWGLSAWMHSDFLVSLAHSNGGGISGFDASGQPQLLLTESKSMKAFEKMYDWVFKQKIANVNDGSQTWDTIMNEFVKGNSAICVGTNKLTQFAQESNMQDDFGIVYPPMGPDMKEYSYSSGLGQMYFIPKTYENMADKLLLLIDDLYELPKDTTREDLIVEASISKIRDEQALDIYVDLATNSSKFVYDAYVMTKIDWTTPSIHEMVGTVLKGQATPGDAVEKNKVQFLNSMKDTMEGKAVTGK